ncbi:unnamed protein product [Pedinophyceae sp. YPF-701]|nr:unnamed protein product [Pedinophyceae sp. YPF-701]
MHHIAKSEWIAWGAAAACATAAGCLSGVGSAPGSARELDLRHSNAQRPLPDPPGNSRAMRATDRLSYSAASLAESVAAWDSPLARKVLPYAPVGTLRWLIASATESPTDTVGSVALRALCRALHSPGASDALLSRGTLVSALLRGLEFAYDDDERERGAEGRAWVPLSRGHGFPGLSELGGSLLVATRSQGGGFVDACTENEVLAMAGTLARTQSRACAEVALWALAQRVVGEGREAQRARAAFLGAGGAAAVTRVMEMMVRGMSGGDTHAVALLAEVVGALAGSADSADSVGGLAGRWCRRMNVACRHVARVGDAEGAAAAAAATGACFAAFARLEGDSPESRRALSDIAQTLTEVVGLVERRSKEAQRSESPSVRLEARRVTPAMQTAVARAARSLSALGPGVVADESLSSDISSVTDALLTWTLYASDAAAASAPHARDEAVAALSALSDSGGDLGLQVAHRWLAGILTHVCDELDRVIRRIPPSGAATDGEPQSDDSASWSGYAWRFVPSWRAVASVGHYVPWWLGGGSGASGDGAGGAETEGPAGAGGAVAAGAAAVEELYQHPPEGLIDVMRGQLAEAREAAARLRRAVRVWAFPSAPSPAVAEIVGPDAMLVYPEAAFEIDRVVATVAASGALKALADLALDSPVLQDWLIEGSLLRVLETMLLPAPWRPTEDAAQLPPAPLTLQQRAARVLAVLALHRGARTTLRASPRLVDWLRSGAGSSDLVLASSCARALLHLEGTAADDSAGARLLVHHPALAALERVAAQVRSAVADVTEAATGGDEDGGAEGEGAHVPFFLDGVQLMDPLSGHHVALAGLHEGVVATTGRWGGSDGACLVSLETDPAEGPFVRSGPGWAAPPVRKRGWRVAVPLSELWRRGQGVGGEEPAADIVFLHGINGDAFRTWRIMNEETTRTWLQGSVSRTSCWPTAWLSPLYPGARLLSYEYPALMQDWSGGVPVLEDISRLALSKLITAGVGERPVVFVAHSLGGLLVKQLLVQAAASSDPATRRLADAVRGCVFFSVPHFGSSWASLGWALRWSAKIPIMGFAPSALLKNLSPGDHLEDLNRRFGALTRSKAFPVLSFLEGKKTSVSLGGTGVKPASQAAAERGARAEPARPEADKGGSWMAWLGTSVTPVTWESGFPGYGDFVVLKEHDHITANKPLDKEDPVYTRTVGFLDRTVPETKARA